MVDEKLPPSPVEAPALAAAAPQADLVNVRDPDTFQIGSIPRSQLASAQQMGYQPVTHDEALKQVNHEKYGGLGEMAKTAVEGGLESATFGLSTGLETGLGISTPEDIQGRREENPISHGVGQVAGLVGSAALLPGAGAAGALEKAGVGAAKSIGLGAEAATLETANAARLAGLTAKEASAVARATAAQSFSTGARVASAGVRAAAETALFQAGDEISQSFSDPQKSIGTHLADIGLAGVLGGVGGVGVKGISELWHSTKGAMTAGALNDLLNKASNGAEFNSMLAGMEPAERAAFLDNASAQAKIDALVSPETATDEAKGFLSEVRKLKPNADEIVSSLERVAPGERATPGMLSASKLVQDTDSDIIKRGTAAGIARANQVGRIEKSLAQSGESLFSEASNASEHSVGKEVNDGVKSWVEERQKYFQKEYGAHREDFKNMELGKSLKKDAVTEFLSDGGINAAPDSNAAKTANRLAKNMLNLKNVEHVMDLRTVVNGEIQAQLGPGGDGAVLQVLKRAKSTLTELREDGMKFATEATGIGNEAGSIASERIANIRRIDAEFAQYKTKLNMMGIQSGIGDVSGTHQLAKKLMKQSTESWATRIFDTRDLDALRFFKAEFPKEFETARKFKLQQLKEKAISTAQGKNSAFEIGTALREIDKIDHPETREILFGKGSARKIDDLQTIYRALPANANPSGTGSLIARMSMFTPDGFILNVADGIKYALSEQIPKLQAATGGSKKAVEMAGLMALKSGAPIEPTAFKRLVDFAQSTIAGETKLASMSRDVFSTAPLVLASKLSAPAREKLDEKLKGLAENPNPLFDVGQGVGHYAPDHGSQLAMTTVQAVNYLNSLRPKTSKKNPLDSEPVVNQAQKAAYNRALDIAIDPSILLPAIKNGSISANDIKHIQAINPGFHAAVAAKLQKNLIDHVHGEKNVPYKTRIGLSMWLGQPMDSSLTGETIRATQPKMPHQPGQGQHVGGLKSGLKSLDKLSDQFQTPSQARELQHGGRHGR